MVPNYKSKEYREKMRKACTGKKHKMSDKFRKHLKKLSLSCAGKPWSKARRLAQKRNPIVEKNRKYAVEWAEVRKRIYERDNWTCKECGVKCNGKVRGKDVI